MTEPTTTPAGGTSQAPRTEKRRRVERVIAACDLCKARKVKCDGELPCAYCRRKNRAGICAFTAPKPRLHAKSAGNTPNIPERQTSPDSSRNPSVAGPTATHVQSNGLDSQNSSATIDAVRGRRANSDRAGSRPRAHDGIGDFGASPSPTVSREDHHDDTAVPLEGRILRDAQGKVIFIGDCAPLSFLQTVRHLIASEVDDEGLAVAAYRDSIIEVAKTNSADRPTSLVINSHDVEALVREYVVAVSGLADLFEHTQLLRDVKTWASGFVSHQNGQCEKLSLPNILNNVAAAVICYSLAKANSSSSQERLLYTISLSPLVRRKATRAKPKLGSNMPKMCCSNTSLPA